MGVWGCRIVTAVWDSLRPSAGFEPRQVIDLTVRAGDKLTLTVEEAAERLGRQKFDVRAAQFFATGVTDG